MTDIERIAEKLQEAQTEQEYEAIATTLRSIKHDAEMMLDLIDRLQTDEKYER